MESKEQIINMIDNVVNEIILLVHKRTDIWSKYVVFSGLWWMGVALTIIPWVLWYIYRK